MATGKHKPHSSASSTNLVWRTSVDLSSKVYVGAGVIAKLPQVLGQSREPGKVLLLSQAKLPPSLVEGISCDLTAAGFTVCPLLLADGEAAKSSQSLLSIWSHLQELKLERQDTMVAIGGGALTDVAGFAASTYLRGLRLFSVPTTLLAQVDAAIGGKTGINLPAGKNLAGTFYFPEAILIDVETLSTLPLSQFRSGLAEIIKYSLIESTVIEKTKYVAGPRPLLSVLEQLVDGQLSWDNPAWPGIIMACVQMKLSVVADDPFELGLRRCLNFGHTLGHALEQASDYQLTHGEAVSIGMIFALKLAVQKAMIDQEDLARVERLLKKAGLPITIPAELAANRISPYLRQDKKRQAGVVKMILPSEKLGSVDFAAAISPVELEAAVSDFGKDRL